MNIRILSFETPHCASLHTGRSLHGVKRNAGLVNRCIIGNKYTHRELETTHSALLHTGYIASIFHKKS